MNQLMEFLALLPFGVVYALIQSYFERKHDELTEKISKEYDEQGISYHYRVRWSGVYIIRDYSNLAKPH